MSETVTIYHNPRCSKSRQALEILEQEGIEANVVQYLVTPPDGDGTPIRCTDGQAKVFAALWSFKGEATTAERIMQRAGLDSAKPSDLFKIKQKDKGKPEPEAQHAAYGALVVTQQRSGLYSMPCAAGVLA